MIQWGGNEIDPIEVTEKTNLFTLELPTPIREGYTFDSWIPGNGNNGSVGSGNGHKHWVYYNWELNDSMATEITVYARWKSDDPSLIFSANGGKFVYEDGTEKETVEYKYSSLKDLYSVENGSFYNFVSDTKKSLEKIAKKEKCSFGSWIDSVGLWDMESGYDGVTLIDWIPARVLSFETNGGTAIPDYEFGIDIFLDDSIYVSDDFITTKDGYVFAGWYTDPILSTPATGTIYTTTTLYAKWIAKDYSVNKSNLQTTYDDIISKLQYKNILSYFLLDSLSDKKIDSETFVFKYTGIMSENEVAILKEMLKDNFSKTIFVSLDLTEATGLTKMPVSSFESSVGLRAIKISEKITNILSSAFSGCASLKSVTLPASVKIIDDSAFANCGALEEITIPKGVDKIGNNVFSKCDSLKKVSLPVSVTSIGNSGFAECVELEEIALPEFLYEVSDSLFSGCVKLSKVTFSTDLNTIGAASFKGCENLASIMIPSNVYSIGQSAFEDCTALKKITIPSSVRAINASTFKGCTSLTSVSIPSTLVSIGAEAFSNCEVLQNPALPSSLEMIGEKAFYNCSSFTEVVLKEGVVTIGAEAFNSCVNMTKINIPSTVEILDKSLFTGCSALKTVDTSVAKFKIIEDRAFVSCTSLTSISIPSTVTDIVSCAFQGCFSLKNVTIPESVKYIGDNVFADCKKLSTITFEKITGWKTSDTKDGVSKTSAPSLSSPSNNVNNFTKLYKDKHWFNEE